VDRPYFLRSGVATNSGAVQLIAVQLVMEFLMLRSIIFSFYFSLAVVIMSASLQAEEVRPGVLRTPDERFERKVRKSSGVRL